MTQIGFKGPSIMKQIKKIAVALSTRGSEVCSSVSASESNQPGTSTKTLIKNERQTDGSVVPLHQLSMYVWVWNVKNNLQWVYLKYITILTAADHHFRRCRLQRRAQFAQCVIHYFEMQICLRADDWLIFVPDDTTGRRCDYVRWCLCLGETKCDVTNVLVISCLR